MRLTYVKFPLEVFSASHSSGAGVVARIEIIIKKGSTSYYSDVVPSTFYPVVAGCQQRKEHASASTKYAINRTTKNKNSKNTSVPTHGGFIISRRVWFLVLDYSSLF
jgi:acyl CoA:acetate/3-ketoacid CoA transferase